MPRTNVEITRTVGFRVLLGLLMAVSLLNLAGCLAVPQRDRDAGSNWPLTAAPTAVTGQFPSHPDLASLELTRLRLHAALVVPDSVRATISKHEVPLCGWGITPGRKFEFPVGELVSSAAEEMFSQIFVSVDRVNDQAAALGNYDVVVELTSLVADIQFDCSGGGRELTARLSLRGKIADQEGQTLLGDASFETKKRSLATGYFDTHSIEVIEPALEHAVLEAVEGLVRRLATKPKLLEYARAFKAPQAAPLDAAPITPAPVTTGPPIY